MPRVPQRLLAPKYIEVVLEHNRYKDLHIDLGFPAAHILRATEVANQLYNVGRAEIAQIDLDEIVVTQTHMPEKRVPGLAGRGHPSGRDKGVDGSQLLQDQSGI